MSLFDPLVLSRPSANTLIMEVNGGYEWFLERDSAHPFAIRDTVDVNRVSVEILQSTDDGRPTKVAFHFDTPLEDDSIAWFAGLEPFEPPPVGQTTAVR